MENFKFNGDWQTIVHLPIFVERLDNPHLGNRWGTEMRTKGLFSMSIADGEDDLPEPTAAQLAAIQFVQQNQEALLKSVFEYHKIVLYPYHEEVHGFTKEEYPEDYPPFETVADLKNVVGLTEVNIQSLEKNGLAYFILSFDWQLDQEHGLSIQMHGLRPIAHGGIGDLNQQKMVEDAGFDYQERYDEWSKNYAAKEDAKHAKIKEVGIYQPNKYGKLKPWQEEANMRYPFWLLHRDDFEAFQVFYADEKNSPYWRVEEVLSVAVLSKNQQIIDFLASLDPKDVYSSICQAIENADLSLMKRLLVFEKDINKERGQQAYLNKLMTQLYKNYADPQQQAMFKEAIALFIERGANPYLQERWTRNAFFCFQYFEDKNIQREIEAYVVGLCEKYGRVAETDEPANQSTEALLQKLILQLG